MNCLDDLRHKRLDFSDLLDFLPYLLPYNFLFNRLHRLNGLHSLDWLLDQLGFDLRLRLNQRFRWLSRRCHRLGLRP
jgi:hypothetical protein